MVIISTRLVAAIIQAVSAGSILGGTAGPGCNGTADCARAAVMPTVKAKIRKVTRRSVRPMRSPPRQVGSIWPNAPRRRSRQLRRVGVGLSRADSNGLFDRRDKNFAVADLPGFGRRADRLDDAIRLFAWHGDLDPHLGQEVHSVFRAAINFSVPLLAPITLDFGHGHAVNADGGERVAHLIELERLDDRNDHFHLKPPRTPPGAAAPT